MSLTPDSPEITRLIGTCTTLVEILRVAHEADGIADSRGTIIPASHLALNIVDAASNRACLRKLTRRHGLRMKIKRILDNPIRTQYDWLLLAAGNAEPFPFMGMSFPGVAMAKPDLGDILITRQMSREDAIGFVLARVQLLPLPR